MPKVAAEEYGASLGQNGCCAALGCFFGWGRGCGGVADTRKVEKVVEGWKTRDVV